MSAQTIQPGRRAATADPASSTSRMPRALRRQARPWLLAAGLAAAGELARGAAVLTGQAALVASLAASATLAITLIGWIVGYKRGYAHTLWAVITTAAAGAWLAAAALSGVSGGLVDVLAAGTVAAALPYWRRNRIPVPDPVRPATVVDADEIREAWAEYVAGGCLPGSRISDPESIKAGVRYEGLVDRRKHTVDDVLTNLVKIGGGLRTPVDRLVVEPHPSRDPARFRLTVITRPPIPAAGVSWPGPRKVLRDGRVVIGPYADGEGLAEWMLYSDNSIWGGFIVGATGSGKSRVLDGIALAAAARGDTVVWYIDGQAGASSPGLFSWYDWAGREPDDVHAMLDAALAIKRARGEELLVDGLEGFTPDSDRPGLLIIIDESHGPLANKSIQYKVALLAREARKVGIGVICADQIPNLSAFGPAETDAGKAIRSSIMRGNVVALKTTERGEQSMVADIGLDPYTLPGDRPGYLYTAARGANRAAAARSYYVADPAAWAARITMPTLDIAAATEAGEVYRTRRARHEQQMAEVRARVEARRAGRPVPPSRRAGPRPDRDVDQAVTAAGGGTTVLALPAWPPADATATATRPAPTATMNVELTDGQRRVLTAIQRGTFRWSDLVDATGLSGAGVTKVLGQLQAMELIAKHGPSQYRAVA